MTVSSLKFRPLEDSDVCRHQKRFRGRTLGSKNLCFFHNNPMTGQEETGID